MMHRSNILLSVLYTTGLLVCRPHADAQVTVQSAQLFERMMTARTFFQVTLNDPGEAVRATLEGEVRTSKGDLVLSFRTTDLLVSPGVSIITADQAQMRSYSVSASTTGQAIEQFQRLPDGHYTYCFRLRSSSGELQDELCDGLDVEDLLYLDLVRPWDGDTVDELRPALTWTMSGGPSAMGTADVRLVLCPAPSGKNAAQAMASERPLFILPHVKERTVPYPFGIPDLEPGKCYAWEVERMDVARVLDRAEPWRFCIRKNDPRLPNKYVLLGHQAPGAIYEATDGRIYFRYDEAYAASHMRCSIIDKDRQLVHPHVQDDKEQQASEGTDPKSIGVNLYELDLSPYALHPGYYELAVADEGGRRYNLKFHLPR